MSTRAVTKRTVAEARSWLADFAIERATEAAGRAGFGWRADPGAPTGYDELLTEFADCTITGRDLRVGRPNALPSVFGSARACFAACFWEATTRIALDARDGFFGDVAVAKSQLLLVEEAGQPEGSLPWRLLRADTIGQAYVSAMTGGGQVPDRLVFATNSVMTNLPVAVLHVVEQVQRRPITGSDTETFLKFMRAEL